jgi:hypothetical protein
MGVVFLHIAGLWLLSQMPGAWRSAGVTQRAITVLLLDDIDQVHVKPQSLPSLASAPVQDQAHVKSQSLSSLASVPVQVPADAPGQVSPMSSGVTVPMLGDPHRDSGGITDEQAAAPLKLQLPKGWLPRNEPRNPALELGQGQRRPLSLENRLASALGDGQWTEERLGDGRLRLRSGNRCVYLQRNRSDELHPFNKTPTPWTARSEAC